MISARKIMALGLVAVLLMAAGTAQAELLLLDTFNNTQLASYYSSSDYGLNQELATRQSGTFAGTSYNVNTQGDLPGYPIRAQVNNSAYGQTLYAQIDTQGCMTLEQDFGVEPDTAISVTIRPITSDEPGNASTSWAAVGVLGADNIPNHPRLNVATDVGAAIVLRSNGGWLYYNNAVSVGSGSVTAADTYDLVITIDSGQLVASLNGEEIVDHTLVGAAATRTVNYVSVGGSYGSGGVSTFDNLQVSNSVIPEPTTLVMLFTGLIGLLCYAWRKRR